MEKKVYEIAVIVKAVNSDFWQTILSGAKAAMRDHEYIHVKTYGPPEESDVKEQVEILERIVDEHPDGIVIASTSNDLTVPAIERAMAAGIPVVTLDNQVSTDKYIAFMGTDSVKAAGTAADAMVADWNNMNLDVEYKKVLVINSARSSKVDLDRDAGFQERIRELVPSIQPMGVQYVENDPALTEQVVCESLEKHKDLIGIFADNDMTGVGVANGIKRAGAAGKVAAYAFDANDVEIQAVKDGFLSGMVVQKPFEMGYRGVMFAVDAIEGRPVEKKIDTGGTIVTKKNLEDADVVKLLYPEKL